MSKFILWASLLFSPFFTVGSRAAYALLWPYYITASDRPQAEHQTFVLWYTMSCLFGLALLVGSVVGLYWLRFSL